MLINLLHPVIRGPIQPRGRSKGHGMCRVSPCWNQIILSRGITSINYAATLFDINTTKHTDRVSFGLPVSASRPSRSATGLSQTASRNTSPSSSSNAWTALRWQGLASKARHLSHQNFSNFCLGRISVQFFGLQYLSTSLTFFHSVDCMLPQDSARRAGSNSRRCPSVPDLIVFASTHHVSRVLFSLFHRCFVAVRRCCFQIASI